MFFKRLSSSAASYLIVRLRRDRGGWLARQPELTHSQMRGKYSRLPLISSKYRNRTIGLTADPATGLSFARSLRSPAVCRSLTHSAPAARRSLRHPDRPPWAG